MSVDEVAPRRCIHAGRLRNSSGAYGRALEQLDGALLRSCPLPRAHTPGGTKPPAGSTARAAGGKGGRAGARPRAGRPPGTGPGAWREGRGFREPPDGPLRASPLRVPSTGHKSLRRLTIDTPPSAEAEAEDSPKAVASDP